VNIFEVLMIWNLGITILSLIFGVMRWRQGEKLLKSKTGYVTEDNKDA